MSQVPFNSVFDTLQRWLSLRSHRQRICILIMGWVAIYFLWYTALQKPLKVERQHIAQHSQELKTQIEIFQTEAERVTKEAEAQAVKQRLSKKTMGNSKLELASSSDSDEIIREILNIQRKVQFVSLKTNATTDSALTNQAAAKILELAFNSNYMDTIIYLEQLEKLPWCLAWDRLDYKVTAYPIAAVNIHLSILINRN